MLFDDLYSGYKLKEFEFLNWGVFHNSIQKIVLDGKNTLITGDIGSGKSTIIDAIITLFARTDKIVYNKAAGAVYKERTLLSYVTGEYKKTNDNNLTKAQRLRGEESFTILIAHFENKTLKENFSMGAVFYLKNNDVKKIYFTTKNSISIKEIIEYKNIKQIKSFLKSKANIFDVYKNYFNSFKRVLGIKDYQSIELLYKTLSMKEVSDLNQFIRNYMLDKSHIEDVIEEMIFSFKESKSAYDAILKAKDEIEKLSVIEKNYNHYTKVSNELNIIEDKENKLDGACNFIEVKIREKSVNNAKITLKEIENKILKKQQEKTNLENYIIELKVKFEKSGGSRIKEIDTNIKNLTQTLLKREKKLQEYKKLLEKVDMKFSMQLKEFYKQQEKIKEQLNNIDLQKETLLKKQTYFLAQNQELTKKLQALKEEIIYIQDKKTNIPFHLATLRDKIQEELGIYNLVFVAELIEIKNEEFNMAIEKLLRNFGLSLLVDMKNYKKVSEYVNNNFLNLKLVFYSIDTNKKYGYVSYDDKRLLINNLEVKNSVFKDYILSRLAKEFDYILCDFQELENVNKGVTKEGLIKSNIKHLKDDRNKKMDYIFLNKDKLKSLKAQYDKDNEKNQLILEELNNIHTQILQLDKKRDILRDILKFEFEDIDVSIKKEIKSLEAEKEKLLQNQNINEIEKEIKESEIKKSFLSKEIDDLNKKFGSNQEKIKEHIQKIEKLKNYISENELLEELKGITTLDSLDKKKRELKNNFISAKKELSKQKNEYEKKIIQKMTEYLEEYKEFKKRADNSIESIEEFLYRLKKLKNDDLPKFESELQRHFHEGTIRGVLRLSEEILNNKKSIKRKITLINNTLKDIEYNPSTYIEIEHKDTKDKEIKDFISTLKLLTQNANEKLTQDKLKIINDLIDRFREEINFKEKISDIRNYFEFAIIEKDFNGEIKEYYTDSSGKSGGQKEKLAYTILASAIFYQFGLNDDKSKIFRFIMIDEAFGKGSDESAKYALNLFEKMNLQTLIVTPKQKIKVITPFVGSIHIVSNNRISTIIRMEIDEWIKLSKSDKNSSTNSIKGN
jgi:uncharacterized protein YPO0396